jgi:hypothetical protein
MSVCDLCGARGVPLSIAMLRIAWSSECARVTACGACAKRCWRTVMSDVRIPPPTFAGRSRNPLRIAGGAA